jgi:outer membrane protein OmpA-like peptidoglycan-associated protein
MNEAMRDSKFPRIQRSSGLGLALASLVLVFQPLLMGAGEEVRGPEATPAELEGQMRLWLEGRFQTAYVAVRAVNDGLVDAVVTVLPSESDTRLYAQEDASRLAGELRDEVLRPLDQELDFRTGSQFAILGPEKFHVEGAGEELTEVIERVARDIIKVVTRKGLALQYLSASGYSGPQMALEVQARGIDLGPQERLRIRDELTRGIEQDLLDKKYGYIHYLEKQSFIEVWDAERPQDVVEWVDPPPPELPLQEFTETPAVPLPPAEEVQGPEDSSWIPLESWKDPVNPGESWVPPPPPQSLERGAPMFSTPPEEEQAPNAWEPTPTDGGHKVLNVTWESATEPPVRDEEALDLARPFTGVNPEGLVSPSRKAQAPPAPRTSEPGALARRLRELRARAPWVPALPPSEFELPPREERTPPRKYPAAPFGIGPGVASQELILRFDTSKHEVKPEERERLRNFLEEVPPERIRGVVIVGHADTRNTDPYNLNLGKRRAEAIKRFLVQEGVKEVRIEANSEGENFPMASDQTDYGRSLNRRAVVEISWADGDRPMHSDRSPFWRQKRTEPAPPRGSLRGLAKPLDPRWPYRNSLKLVPRSGE